MEIHLSLTADQLALNQWALQTLTNAYLVKQHLAAVAVPRGLQAADAANIVWNELVRFLRERHQPKGNELADVQTFNTALAKTLFGSCHLLLLDMLVVPGVCRFCGCTMRFACPGRCSWMDQLGTICSDHRCVRKAGPAVVGSAVSFPHLNPAPTDVRPDPAGGEVAP